MKRPQSALFDRLAAGSQLYAYPPESLRKLNELVKNKGRTLDVGCGDGTIPQAFDAPWVTGFDVSFRCAALARGRGVVSVVADAAGGFPYATDSFDTVYCVDVLHHLERRWRPVFDEVNRVLRPGGTLVIVEPDARNAFVRWTQAPDSPIRVAPCDNEPAIDPSDLLPLLQACGFEASCHSIHIEGEQVERSVFPLWQRLAKAPFTLLLSFLYRNVPNKFAIIVTKAGDTRGEVPAASRESAV
ncbi:MAG: class I SAM-dependent methyltransferase [Candidatus Hydrogenedentes bacterium]|nr:class I SAM-dependent methyltransferase [Candidatus Hydrogenedentota bacterium]